MISMTWPQYLRGECGLDGYAVKLSDLQTELLALLLLRRRQLVSWDEIIENLWHPDTEPINTRRIVFFVLRCLRKKLGAQFQYRGHFARGFELL